MDPKISTELPGRIQRLFNIYGVTVTSQAQLILGECLTAVTYDPHHSWPAAFQPTDPTGPAKLQEFQTDMLDALPSTLANMASEKKLKSITSFDLLHGMSRIIDHICPFDKAPP